MTGVLVEHPVYHPKIYYFFFLTYVILLLQGAVSAHNYYAEKEKSDLKLHVCPPRCVTLKSQLACRFYTNLKALRGKINANERGNLKYALKIIQQLICHNEAHR